MGTTREQIRGWLKRGDADGAKYMLVICDTYDYEDYPVYAKTTEEFDKEFAEHNGKNMAKIMEVYDLNLAFEMQLLERRAWHFPSESKFNFSDVAGRIS